MFDHPNFRKYTFSDLPLNRDLYLMDEKWMPEYERSWVATFNGGNYTNVGYISYAAARVITAHTVELSWYPNIFDRFHEVKVSLPKDQFLTCIGCWQYDEKPHIFVKSEWLRNLHLRSYSVFAMVDADGVKSALTRGSLTRPALIALREQIDKIARRYPAVSFVSFADSLLLKSNWFVGTYDSSIKYTYRPEVFFKILDDIRLAYRNVLTLAVYATLTQGSNEYYDDALLHISPTKNHISLNSLGLPFAQLMSIDHTARRAVKDGLHRPAELYMDDNFYHSLRFVHGFDKNSTPRFTYRAPMSSDEGSYVCSDFQTVMNNLDFSRTRRYRKRSSPKQGVRKARRRQAYKGLSR
jgi:hypothetical protein